MKPRNKANNSRTIGYAILNENAAITGTIVKNAQKSASIQCPLWTNPVV